MLAFVASLLLASSGSAQSLQVTWLAGLPSSPGSADGSDVGVRFRFPWGIATDLAGNLYVADTDNHTIRKRSADGVWITLAGLAGSIGTADGTGSAARFNYPRSVTVDQTGNVYVADSYNHTIRMVTPTGVVTTIAGAPGVLGRGDGEGPSARFALPRALALNASGTALYVADSDNSTVRKVALAPAGPALVTTIAGLPTARGSADGVGSAARFFGPRGIAVDQAENLYVSDTFNHTIRKVTPDGVVTTIAGLAGSPGSTDGTGNAARFNLPHGLEVDAIGVIYVADTYNHTIRRVTPDGVVTTLAGHAGTLGTADGTGDGARLNYPHDVTSLPDGRLLLIEPNSQMVREGLLVGQLEVARAGAGGGRVTSQPAGIECGNDCVYAYPRATRVTLTASPQAGSYFVGWQGACIGSGACEVTVDTASLVTGVFEILPVTSQVTTRAGRVNTVGDADGDDTASRFRFPWAIAVGGDGTLYVADTDNHTIRRRSADGVWVTLAGAPGMPGTADGTGSVARFNYPNSVAVDQTGNVFVADSRSHTIRRISPAGFVTTIAGAAGVPGNADGSGLDARFRLPRAIAVTSVTGTTLYVADTDNFTIRRIQVLDDGTSAVVTTLAGSPSTRGSADGTGSAARFFNPRGIVVDHTDNVYVADTGNHTIRKVTVAGVVTTLAGLAGTAGSADGMGTAARFFNPHGLSIDDAGVVYVADTDNHTIRRVTPTGTVTTIAGLPGAIGSADGIGSAARFHHPHHVAVHASGVFFVANTFGQTIRQGVLAEWLRLTLAGTGAGVLVSDPAGTTCTRDCADAYPLGTTLTLTASPAPGSGFAGWSGACTGTGPCQVSVNATVSVTATFEVLPVTLQVTTLAGTTGTLGTADGADNAVRFRFPWGVVVDAAGNTYVADTDNHTIRKRSADGVWSTLAGLAGTLGSADGQGAAARFNYPRSLAVDAAGVIYVADSYSHTIRRVTPAGEVSTIAGAAGVGGNTDGLGADARFRLPRALALNLTGTTLYVADTDNFTIRRVQLDAGPSTIVTTIAGVPSGAGSADGKGPLARFRNPLGIAVDAAETIYVADTGNHTIRRITPAGVVTTLAGVAGSAGHADGVGAAARFSGPFGLAADAGGTLFVVDSGNRTIRRVTPAGVVTTIAGVVATPGVADGTGGGARFSAPRGLAIGPTGAIYVADAAAHTIRTGQLADAAPLAVTLGGQGTGAVRSSPPGITCGVDCREPFLPGTVATLSATPFAGSRFTGWSGACTGTAACELTMAAAATVTATFEPLDVVERVTANAPALSRDGRSVAFVSSVAPIDAADGSGQAHVYVRDRITQRVVCVSASTNGVLGNGPSAHPSISADGRYVAFSSRASNLVPGDTNGAADVFLHDRDADANGVFDERSAGGVRTTRVSVGSTGTQANGPSAEPDLSADGFWVAFTSHATNLVSGDGNGASDVFVHQWPSGQTTRVSLRRDGVEGNGQSSSPAVSRLGDYVVFASDATSLSVGDANDARDVFRWERATRELVRLTGPIGAAPEANGPSDKPDISDDARVIVFQTLATNLTPVPDANETWDVIVMRPRTSDSPLILGAASGASSAPRVVSVIDMVKWLASIAANGTAGNGASTTPSVSADGGAVALASDATDLAPPAPDQPDVHVSPRAAPEAVDGSGDEASAAIEDVTVPPAVSGDGRFVAYEQPRQGASPAGADTPTVVVAGPALVVGSLEGDSAPLAGGTVTTLRGIGLVAGLQVWFGHIAATAVEWVSEQEARVTVPPAASPGVVDLRVAVPGSVALVLPEAFTYLADVPVPRDEDGDGLDDAWEAQFGLDANSGSGDNGPDGDPDHDGVSNADEQRAGTHPTAVFTSYFAEGATSDFFATSLALLNVEERHATVLLRFQRREGSERSHLLSIPPKQRATLTVSDVPDMRAAEFSTVVESDVPIVADRTMAWGARPGYGAHAESAIRAPARTWYLAEGATHSGFSLYYLLQNPNATECPVRVRYLRPVGAPIEKIYRLPPRSRTNIDVGVEEFGALGRALAATDVSAVIESLDESSIIVERAMYLSNQGRLYNAGHGSAGITEPSTEWFLAEGATGPYFDLFLLVANPTETAADVEATYLLPDGTTIVKPHVVAPTSRFNIWVDYADDRLGDTAVSATIRSTNGVPIIVERAMWWPGPTPATWHEAHNSAGARATGTLWAMAAGEVGGPPAHETYILVANTSSWAGEAQVTLVFEDGASTSRTVELAPTSRTNVPVGFMFSEAAGRRFGVLVESLGSEPVQVVVEQAMYSDAGGVWWAAGTNALATRLR